jgi:hypothetical protein
MKPQTDLPVLQPCVYRSAVGNKGDLFCAHPKIHMEPTGNILTRDARGQFRPPVHCETCRLASEMFHLSPRPIPAEVTMPADRRQKTVKLSPCAETHFRHAMLSHKALIAQLETAIEKAKQSELRVNLRADLDRYKATAVLPDWKSYDRLFLREATSPDGTKIPK